MPWFIRPGEHSPHKANLASQFQGQANQKLPFAGLLLELAKLPSDAALDAMHADTQGLSEAEARQRLVIHGPNEVAREKMASWPKQLWRAFKTPFSLLLGALAIVSFATGDSAGGSSIAVMVLLSPLLGFFQEFRSGKAAEKLKAMVSTKATVLRSGQKKEIPVLELVPGDLCFLSAGDMIPADSRLLSCTDVFVSQAALTGEALPVEKSPSCPASCSSALESPNLCFMGTNVVSGAGLALVLKTGQDSYFGCLASSLIGQRPLTSFEKGVNRFTLLMLRFMLVMAPLVFLVNGLAKHHWFEAFMFAVAVGVSLTPEMLPMIVTVNLAKGALAMSKKQVVVKRLNSIQNFGAMDVLCTDKTGTLTENKVALLRHIDASGFSSQKVLNYGYLNSFYQTGLKSLLDVAILGNQEAQAAVKGRHVTRKIGELPFDFVRRRMSVVLEEEGRHILICKGALEEVFDACSQAEDDGERAALDDELKNSLRGIARGLNEDGLRVIAVAYKEMGTRQETYSSQDEGNLVLLGYLAFLDPPKASAAQAIASLEAHGVRVKVLSGDNELVSRKICSQVGINADPILLGPAIDLLSDAQLADAAESVNVFAKLTPSQKQRIVQALHDRDHVVGFLGDGINDAPALKAADVGISVNNAVDIAKESADIILLENSLMVLQEGVLEGRKVFGNIIKYIKMGASSNFGNSFSILGSSLLLPFLPMLPVQMLLQNLLYDFSQTAIPFDSVDEDYLARPRRWEIADIGRFMLFIGPVSSLFDYSSFALLWWVFHANSPARQGLFQTGWFVEGLCSQALVVHLIRTNKVPFLQSWAAWPLLASTTLIMAIGIWLPYSPLASSAHFQPLPLSYFAWLALTLLAYAAAAQAAKQKFIKRYGLK